MAKTKRVIQGANTITEGVVNTLLNDGWSASRINVQGQYIEHLHGYNKGGYRPSGSRKGFADVACCIKGRAVVIEVKFGEDVQSPDQIEFQAEWERAGGLYVIVKTWFDFIMWYDNYSKTL